MNSIVYAWWSCIYWNREKDIVEFLRLVTSIIAETQSNRGSAVAIFIVVSQTPKGQQCPVIDKVSCLSICFFASSQMQKVVAPGENPARTCDDEQGSYREKFHDTVEMVGSHTRADSCRLFSLYLFHLFASWYRRVSLLFCPSLPLSFFCLSAPLPLSFLTNCMNRRTTVYVNNENCAKR